MRNLIWRMNNVIRKKHLVPCLRNYLNTIKQLGIPPKKIEKVVKTKRLTIFSLIFSKFTEKWRPLVNSKAVLKKIKWQLFRWNLN